MWQFFEHQPGRTLVDPIEEAFFSSDSDDENARHLVRESIQNSLDARERGQTVKVRFTFGELRGEFVDELFEDLSQHLVARGSGLLSPPRVDQGMRFLAVEDFGTTGLVGDSDQLQDHDDDAEDNFFYFWRNVGRSGKRAGTLGKWGLGKTVFPASSRINTFFGLTRRRGGDESYLLGRCDIKTHRINGTQYDPYGYFARWENGKPLAISNSRQIERVRDAFHLARSGSDDTPGLSIIIPHVVDEFNVEMLSQEVIENYFWPILKGDLVIEVQENYLTPPETTMDAEWMRGVAEDRSFRQRDKELADTIALANWAASSSEITSRVHPLPPNRSPSWDDAKCDSAGLERLIQTDEEDNPFAVAVPVYVRPVDGPPKMSLFTVCGRRVLYSTSRRSYLVRQGINVARACPRNPSHHVFFVIVNEGPLAQLLGDAENPSHTEFERTDAIKQGYRHGVMRTIQFVTSAPAAVKGWLDRRDDDFIAGLFGDVFWKVPIVPDTTKPRRRRKVVVAKGKTVGPSVDVPRRVPSIAISQSPGGFQVKDNPERERQIESVTIVAGYEGNRGDQFKTHSKHDFDFYLP